MTDRNDPRLMSLAHAAMSHAIGGRPNRAAKATQAIGDEYGGDGIVQAALLWIDRLLYDSGREHDGKPVSLAFLDAETGTVGSADDVDPAVAWCGRLIAARFADDEATFAALVNSFHSDETFSRHMGALLSLIALHYRIAMGIEPDPPAGVA